MKQLFSAILIFCTILSLSADQAAETTNAVDANGKRTGHWVITGALKPTKGYKPEQVIEEGSYAKSKKVGLWKRYYPSGKKQSEITYVNNVPNGPYTTYYATGKVEEKGNWKYNKNTGAFKRFHPNGNLAQEFQFSEHGIRNGIQKYFHENGQLEVEVRINNGQEEGTMKRYYANGDLKETKNFNTGKIESGSIETFAMKKPKVQVKESAAVPEKKSTPVQSDKPNISVFSQTGNNTLYNKNRQISQTGYFKNGRLWDGKWYRYDANGLLEAIEVYKEGKFIGHRPIDASMR